jgi:hypothetical protein
MVRFTPSLHRWNPERRRSRTSCEERPKA